ncbi:hypothetical protein [Aquifex aeolicus]|uniref:hypothetical protein n=1 Tax=Aquifex aeolicus TaxID=63363 RepID=UPI0013E89DB2|nr:hypothetical protein [Aquifex aeolicus]
MKLKKPAKKTLEEIGKHYLNIGVAIIVFAIIQPIVQGKFNIKVALYFGLAYFIVFSIAIILLVIGGSCDE